MKYELSRRKLASRSSGGMHPVKYFRCIAEQLPSIFVSTSPPARQPQHPSVLAPEGHEGYKLEPIYQSSVCQLPNLFPVSTNNSFNSWLPSHAPSPKLERCTTHQPFGSYQSIRHNHPTSCKRFGKAGDCHPSWPGSMMDSTRTQPPICSGKPCTSE